MAQLLVNQTGQDNVLATLGTLVGGGTLDFYSGAIPATTTLAASGTVLATVAVPATPWTEAAGSTTIASGPWTTTGLTAAGSGTNATFARFVVGGVTMMQVDVGFGAQNGAWAATTAYASTGATVTASGNVYEVLKAGTSGATPPSSTFVSATGAASAAVSSGTSLVLTAAPAGLAVGQLIADTTTPASIAANTQVTVVSGTTLTLSNAIAGTIATTDTLTFSGISDGAVPGLVWGYLNAVPTIGMSSPSISNGSTLSVTAVTLSLNAANQG